jgi:Ca2+-binding EF-hand superfamily protein
MKIDAAIIQSFPDELFKTYWVNWCDKFLSRKIDIEDNALAAFNIKSIEGMPQNADPPSRAIELFRTGVLNYPININGSKTNAWRLLSNDENIISNFGFISYVVSKTFFDAENSNNVKLKKAFSAICAISLVKQNFKYKLSNIDYVISANTIYQKIISSFSTQVLSDIAYQYLASAMICTIKRENLNEQLIDAILANGKIANLVVTNNENNGGNIRETIDENNLESILNKFISKELSFNDTTNQRFCNFFVGNYSDNPTRGYVNNARQYFNDFIIECSNIEVNNWSDKPFEKIYSNENYSLENEPTFDVLQQLKAIFNQFSDNKNIINELMISLKEGALEAIRILGWKESTPINIETLNTIFYGAPGTGKSHKVESILNSISDDKKERITFHPEFDNASFVGGYKPISEINTATGEDEIKYKFVPQTFINIYVNAWKDIDSKYYLAIEEINRGNCAEIFGELFQLLDRNSNYSISPSKELREHLQKELGLEHEGIKGGKMKLPNNLILMATMNTSDQSLFPMDSAFKRRWAWEYVPINYDELNEDGSSNESFNYIVKIDQSKGFKWIDFIKEINSEIKSNSNLGMDKCIGNYFIKASNNEIEIEELINKTVFYLWNDVFKDEENGVFPENVTYEDFFPIKTKGIENLNRIIENLQIPTVAL